MPTAEVLTEAPPDAGNEPIQEASVVGFVPKSLLSETRRDELRQFLREELFLAESERSQMMRNIAYWKIVYAAPDDPEPKDFPFQNAANMTVPLAKEIINTIVAQLVQSTMTTRPRWNLKDLAPEWEPFVDDIERFMDTASDRDLKMDSTGEIFILEAAKFGTAIMEVAHKVDIRKTYKYTPDGLSLYRDEHIYHDGPISRNIPLQNFWIRPHETDIQEAAWVAKELWLTTRTVRNMLRQGKFETAEKTLKSASMKHGTVDQVAEKIDTNKSMETNLHQIFQMYVKFDIGGDEYELQIYYSKDADEILGIRFNPYWHGMRPFVKMVYFPVENRFYGDGLCNMLDSLQEEISAIRNRRADNATIANLKMFLTRSLVRGLQPGDPLYAGKVIRVTDPFNDVRELSMGEVYPSTVFEENIVRDYADRLSGHSEATAGAAMPVSRTTASAQIALLNEQAKRIDMTIRSCRKAFDQVSFFTLQLYHQFGTKGKALAWMGRTGLIVEGIFRLPRRLVELGLALRASSPTSQQNKQIKRENALASFNLVVQLYREFLPLVQGLAPEAMAPIVREMARSAQKFMADVLETFESSNPEDVLAGLAVFERVLPVAEDLGGRSGFEGRAQGAEILTELSRLEGLLTEAADFAARSRGGSGERGARAIPSESRFSGRRRLSTFTSNGASASSGP